MHAAVHGIDLVIMIIAALIFILGGILSAMFVEPRVMKAIWACLMIGLALFVLALAFTG